MIFNDNVDVSSCRNHHHHHHHHHHHRHRHHRHHRRGHRGHHHRDQQLQEGMCLLCNDCCVMQEKSTCLFLSCQNKQPVASVALPGKRLKKVAAVKNMDRKRVFRTQDVRRFRQTAMRSEDLCWSMVLAEQYKFCTTAVDALASTLSPKSYLASSPAFIFPGGLLDRMVTELAKLFWMMKLQCNMLEVLSLRDVF